MISNHQMLQRSQSQDVPSSWQTRDDSAHIEQHKCDLLENLKDAEYREGFVDSHVYTGIAFQMRAMREKRKMTQAEVGQVARMAQERISILEDPNSETKPTLKTLLRIARAFNVGLQVRFSPFRKLIEDAVRTDEDELNVPSFDEELADGLERDLLTEKRIASSLPELKPLAAAGMPSYTTCEALSELSVPREALSPKDGNRAEGSGSRQEESEGIVVSFSELVAESQRRKYTVTPRGLLQEQGLVASQ
ncbi:MAG: helix-turn-helix transcriptional regulator [Bryobacterales bacterium]